MLWLIAGLLLFIGIHLLPSAPRTQTELKTRLGTPAYMGLFSLIAATGLGLMIWGMSQANFHTIYNPPSWGRGLALALMPLAFILLTAAYLPCNLGRKLRHPMLLGVTLWASLHLLANGDLASLLLFGSLGSFALYDIYSANRREAYLPFAPQPWWRDVLATLIGLVAAVAVMHAHRWIAGVPLL